LIRACVLRIDDGLHWALITLHHIITDGWSTEILKQELVQLYASLDNRAKQPLKEIDIQYADYACWQREWLQGDVLQKQLNYWMSVLEGAPELIQLPCDKPRPLVQTFNGAEYRLSLSTELVKNLYQLSKKESVSLFMSLLSVFYVLLYRFTGQNDICIGTPVAGRNRTELESIPGLFVNTLVLRGIIARDFTFKKLLDQVRKTTLDAYQYQEFPFERLINAMKLERSLSYSPIFQVLFVLQNTPRISMQDAGIRMSPLEIESVSSKFDITLSVQELSDSIACCFQYNTDLFDLSTIKRMASSFEKLIDELVSSPNSKISNVNAVGVHEQHYLLRDLHNNNVDVDEGQIHRAFEAQVKHTPGAVAVLDAKSTLTYGELNAQANQVAWYLVDLGVKQDQMVGVCMDRSIDMLVALLAILKVGGAYVPMAPDYPEERIKYMVAQSQIRVLLTNRNLDPDLFGMKVNSINLKMDRAHWQDKSTSNLNKAHGDLNLAYVIFTSGSTGKPKGVQLTHKGLGNVVQYMHRTVGLQASDRLLALSAISFDIASLELLLPITSGAGVVIANEAVSRDPREISRLAKLANANIVQATPQTWRMIVTDGEDLPRLKTIVCGGEPLPMPLAKQMLCLADKVINGYGPSETTIYSTSAYVTKSDIQITLGSAIDNTQVYVLDEDMNLTPIGVPGELYIGGNGVARGYLNQPGLTAEKFVPNPFSGDGSRLYSTGDLVKRLQDGQLEYITRIDNQIKVDGYRIELGEIEHSLSQHREVDNAAVIVKSYDNNLRKIVAYITSPSGADVPSDRKLRDYLRKTLPAFMVPAEFIHIGEFPLTPNQKLDRKKLSTIVGKSQHVVNSVDRPRNEVEQKLYQMWATLLELETVGIEDSFFDIGGNSLLAVFMMDEIENTFGIRLPIARLFESNTISALSEFIIAETATEAKTNRSPVVTIKKYGNQDTPPLICVHPAGGGIVTYNSLINLLNLKTNVFGIQALGLLGEKFEFDSVGELASYYIEQMGVAGSIRGGSFIGYSVGGLIAIEMAQQLIEKGDQVGSVVLLDTVVTNHLESKGVLSDTEILFDHFKDVAIDEAELEGLSLEDKIRAFLSEDKRLGVEPSQEKILQIIDYMNIFKSISSICKRYVPESYPGNTMLISTRQSPALESWKDRLADMRHVTLDCEHHNMMDRPQVDKVASHVRRFLVEEQVRGHRKVDLELESGFGDII
jgi:amino acid adenylation domain-containing protein